MNLWKFRNKFNKEILMRQAELPSLSNMPGFCTTRMQNSLNLAVSCLIDTDEAYFEVGSYGGRSLEAAIVAHESVPAYSCDIVLQDSLSQVVEKYGITFFHQDFGQVDLSQLKHPIGVYYFDGDHKYDPTYLGLDKIEPYLADKALVFLDDICYPQVYNATRDFIKDHSTNFTIVHELWPECDIFAAMTNNCLDDWDNGWCIIEFERNPERLPLELADEVVGSFWRGGGPGVGVIYPKKYKYIHGKEEHERWNT